MSKPHQQHLYLVLDNPKPEEGYNVHKIDVTRDLDPDDTDDLDSSARPLPGPPLIRVDAKHHRAKLFVAHGTKILAMQRSPGRAAPALDTRTMAITAIPLPQPSNRQLYYRSAFVSVGDKLYSMDERHFKVLCLGAFGGGGRCRSWRSVPSPPPFYPGHVACYAVHPDGRTIFFSVYHGSHLEAPFARPRGRVCSDDDYAGATVSFDTETLKWTLRGYWKLPFEGQAHYDAELDAWVGLLKGRICTCDVPPPITGEEDAGEQPKPAQKLGENQLFRHKGRRHRGGALVYMGSSTFCVLECVTKDEFTEEQWEKLRSPPPLLLYVRTFGLKYGKEGRLRMASCGRRAACYELPERTNDGEVFMFSLRALWV
ncbi:hypothetical protein ACP70R_038855 [Stipagrostis hirtigluma subsp. patula]